MQKNDAAAPASSIDTSGLERAVENTCAEIDRLRTELAARDPGETALRELRGRLSAFLEIHEYWEFEPNVTEESFDDWLHSEIRRLKEQLAASSPEVTEGRHQQEKDARVVDSQYDPRPSDAGPSATSKNELLSESREAILRVLVKLREIGYLGIDPCEALKKCE